MKKIVIGLLSIAVVLSMSACQTGAVKASSVKSEALQKVDYNADADSLVLVFERGTYEFAGVPQNVYDGLMASKSKGEYFQSKIKGKYKAKKIN